MKKIKYLSFFAFAIIMSLVTMITCKAATAYKTNKVSSFEKNVKVTLRTDGMVSHDGWAIDNNGKYSIYYKHSSSNYALCTLFSRENPDATYNCSRQDSGWSKDNAFASGVATIILEASGGINKTLSNINYFNAELAINKFINSSKYADKTGQNSVDYNGKNLETINNLSSVGSNAVDAYNNFAKKKMKLKVGAIKCNGNKCSAKVSFSKVKKGSTLYDEVSINDEDIQVNVTGTGTYSSAYYQNGSVYIENPSGKIKINVEAVVRRKYYVAQNYTCGNNQSITLNSVKAQEQTRTLKGSNEFTATIEGTSSDDSSTIKATDTCDLMLYKISSDGEPLTGSAFKLIVDNIDRGITQFESRSEDSDIANGHCIGSGWSEIKYEEVNFPAGYKKTIGTIHNNELTDNEYEIKDDPDTNLIINKIDGDTKAKLSKATLAIYQGGKMLKWNYVNANGEVTENPVEDGQGNYYAKIDSNGAKNTWETSDKGMHFIELDYDIEYRIEELTAPDKYIINNQTTVVTLTNEEGKRNQSINIADYQSSITISKQDITTKKELPGAKLQIVDAQGNIKEEWISTDKPHIVTTLMDGFYYLIETTAPKGYELNVEKIGFQVENGKAKSKVVMYNTPSKVTVADTLLGKNIIAYVLGSMLIIAGAGVLFYEIKKKKRA